MSPLVHPTTPPVMHALQATKGESSTKSACAKKLRMPFFVLAVSVLLSPTVMPTPASSQEVEQPAEHAARGIIRRIREGRVTIQHEAIEGVMPAMTMPFFVRSEQLEGLAVDMPVEFVFVFDNRRARIVSIRAR